ncbi:MAG: hypothetical protein LBR05_03800 [Azoarcus sp.]|nr:hypothetical protein [Azoarcus sp.]
MNATEPRRRFLGAFAALALSTGVVAMTVPVGAAAAAGKIPRLDNGKPDFSGIWQTTSAAEYDLEPHIGRVDAPPGPGVVIDGDGFIPYLPKALEQKQKNFAARQSADPTAKGYTQGVPRQIYSLYPFQILQRARDVTIVPQFGYSIRTIHTNGTKHPTEDNDFWLGDSRGHWEGDTLVVDITDFYDETWLDRAGNFHSSDLHVVERWKFLDANTIEYRATLEDPQVYAQPWTLSVILHRHREKNFQLIEDYRYTLPYDQYYPPKKP